MKEIIRNLPEQALAVTSTILAAATIAVGAYSAELSSTAGQDNHVYIQLVECDPDCATKEEVQAALQKSINEADESTHDLTVAGELALLTLVGFGTKKIIRSRRNKRRLIEA